MRQCYGGYISLLSSEPGGSLTSRASFNRKEYRVMEKISISKLEKGSVQRAKALSIPKSIYIPILRRVKMWVKCSGEEWAVDRLKAIKLDVLRVEAGMPPISTWIAHNSLFLKGEFGLLQKWMSKSDKNFQRGIQLLQIYTFLCSGNYS